MDSDNFLVVSSSSIDNKKIEEYLGIVVGSTVRARNVGSDFFASLKNLVGGEVVSYSRLLERARDQAYKRMIQEAKEKELMESSISGSKHLKLFKVPQK